MLSVGLTRGWIRGVGVWNNASVFCCSFNGASTILLPEKLTWSPEIRVLKRNMRGSRWVFRGVYWVLLLNFDILWFRDSPGFWILHRLPVLRLCERWALPPKICLDLQVGCCHKRAVCSNPQVTFHVILYYTAWSRNGSIFGLGYLGS